VLLQRRGKKKYKMPPLMAALVGEANMAFANGEDAKALEYLLRVIQECPNAPEPFMTVGLIYEDRKQPDQAVEYLMIAAHLLGRDAPLWKRCANMWRELKDDRRALYCYNKAIKFYEPKPGASHDFDSLWQRIQLYKNLTEYKKCTDALYSLLKLRPNDPDATKELARVFHMSEQLDKAEQTLKDSFDRMKTAIDARDATVVMDLDVINMLAEIQISAHHFDDASNTIHWAQTNFHETPESPFPMDLTYVAERFQSP
jgi:general transcription factor 3C polypeptide 3 (transcription factor C subunit 4)